MVLLRSKAATSPKPRASSPVPLHWLGFADADPSSTYTSPTRLPVGSAFGIPWAEGEVDKTTAVKATADDGTDVPLQTWPAAYWPSGTLKWTGHALPANIAPSSVTISLGTPPEPAAPVSLTQDASANTITINTGSFSVVLSTSGNTLVQSLSLDGAEKANGGKLVFHVQDGPDVDLSDGGDGAGPTVQELIGSIEKAEVEQEGPVRAVVKFTGTYAPTSASATTTATSASATTTATFPFTLRAYVSAGSRALRLVHFFVWDGDKNKDFIKGIGLTYSLPLSDELWDRHIRLASVDGGVFGESVRTLSGLRRDAGADVLNAQFNGRPVPDISTWPATVSGSVDSLAVWADWRVDQLSADHFTIDKRSTGGTQAAWLRPNQGARASGTGFVGGAKAGGTLFAIRDFWEGHPRGVDVRGANGDAAQVSLWAWSPRAPAMDMRHYDTVAHGLDLAYEDVGDPDPDPTGVGRSYEFVIEAWGPGSSADGNAAPSRDEVAGFAKDWSIQPQLVADSEFYAAHKLFGGHWAPPSGAAPDLESRKDALLNFYVNEVEQRRWYGFWDYGDVQHTYDQTRHEWRYDTGGYAWDNGELGTDLWLWLSFMRTGRADVFHRARALTRHLAETDFHHTGTFAGLGSRHNVSHWGDGAKEARVGSAWLKRPFFYLTTDELTGDHMRAALQADESIVKWEPLRKILDKPDPGPGRVRIGPDWTALAGNWWCEWERGNDDYYLNRIKTGMHDIGEMKYGMWSGYTAAVNWDPATGHLQDIGGEFEATYHLSMLFGGGEFLMEAMDLITDEPDFDTKWVEFCQYFNASADEKQAKYGVAFNSGGFEQLYAKLQAYAGERLGDDSLKQAAWQVLNTNTVGVWDPEQQVGGSDVLVGINEIPNLATNDAAARSLAEYAVLEIAPELAPASLGTRSAKSSARPRSEVAFQADWDQATIAGSVRGKDIYDEKDRRVHDEKKSNAKGKGKAWKRLLCIS
ncbi:hypothetical protein K523DRAFT_324967 [Schizophyllum commune Tattone D]|nr:hypothetical protein K523DRAFT_324967 [Schizophyllum commune Tattone D]